MATVTVTTFSEFRTAAAQYGNTIVCPEGAIWDMAEIDPDNTITQIEINSSVTGNDTEIRNFRGRIICSLGITIKKLHIINMLCEIFNLEYGGAIYASPKEGMIQISQCKISMATGINVKNALYNISPYKCAINLQMAYAGNCTPIGSYQGLGNAFYNRISVNAPNATGIMYSSWLPVQRSEIIINAPLATNIFTGAGNSTIRGNLQNVTASSGTLDRNRAFDVINAASAPNFPASTSYILRVTDAQMRDAAYLQSIGFVIGTETE